MCLCKLCAQWFRFHSSKTYSLCIGFTLVFRLVSLSVVGSVLTGLLHLLY